MRFHRLLVSLAILCVPVGAVGQGKPTRTKYPTRLTLGFPVASAVRDALVHVDAHFEAQVAEWIRITQIAAPSRNEGRRAAYVRAQLKAMGLTVAVDSMGNISTRLRGTRSSGGSTVIFVAHLDTVHPIEADVTVTRKADGTLHGPGVLDNSSSVANLLSAARAIVASRIRVQSDVVLLFTTQEELGMKGLAHWINHHPRGADLLVVLDGGLGPVNYGAVGLYWSIMTVAPADPQTAVARPQPHPARPALRCVLDLYRVPLSAPDAPVAPLYNIGLLRVGQSVQGIPEAGTITMDLRAADPAPLERLDGALLGKCPEAGFRRMWIQRAPEGETQEPSAPGTSAMARTAIDVLDIVGLDVRPGPEGGAPGSGNATALSRARGGDQHTLREWARVESARIATKQIVLLAAALAGVE